MAEHAEVSLGLLGGAGQVGRPDFGKLAADSEPGDLEAGWMPPGQHEAQGRRRIPDQLVDPREHGRPGEVADVVDDQRDRSGQALGQPGQVQRECVIGRVGQFAGDLARQRGDTRERRPDVGPELARPAIAVVQTQPSDASGSRGRCRPARACDGLARPRGAADQRDPVLGRRPFDQLGYPRPGQHAHARPRHGGLGLRGNAEPAALGLVPLGLVQRGPVLRLPDPDLPDPVPPGTLPRPAFSCFVADGRLTGRARHPSPDGPG